MRFGNSELFIKGFNTDCLHFGTRQILKTPLLYQRME